MHCHRNSGTLYPILHSLEERGYLVSSCERHGTTERRVYEATCEGRTVLKEAKLKVLGLNSELLEGN